jgi:hypothetical protein
LPMTLAPVNILHLSIIFAAAVDDNDDDRVLISFAQLQLQIAPLPCHLFTAITPHVNKLGISAPRTSHLRTTRMTTAAPHLVTTFPSHLMTTFSFTPHPNTTFTTILAVAPHPRSMSTIDDPLVSEAI